MWTAAANKFRTLAKVTLKAISSVDLAPIVNLFRQWFYPPRPSANTIRTLSCPLHEHFPRSTERKMQRVNHYPSSAWKRSSSYLFQVCKIVTLRGNKLRLLEVYDSICTQDEEGRLKSAHALILQHFRLEKISSNPANLRNERKND
eukprot:c52144_g1_i1 orf=3-437(-)